LLDLFRGRQSQFAQINFLVATRTNHIAFCEDLGIALLATDEQIEEGGNGVFSFGIDGSGFKGPVIFVIAVAAGSAIDQ
jgi:hypothetical protein